MTWSVRASRTVDLEQALARTEIVGTAGDEGIACHHPRAMADLAGEVVDLVRQARALVTEELGAPWDFPVELHLVPVERVPDSYVWRRTARSASFPLMVPAGDETLDGVVEANPDLLLHGLVHEVVEFSLLYPSDDRPAIAGDTGGFFGGRTTRWFREGVATWAGWEAHERLVGGVPLRHYFPRRALALAGAGLLEWSQGSPGSSESARRRASLRYQAAYELVRLLAERSRDVLPDTFAELRARGADPADGEALADAVEGATGLDDLQAFILSREAPLLRPLAAGWRLVDHQTAHGLGIEPGLGLIHAAAPPRSHWQPLSQGPPIGDGDVLTHLDGRPIRSGTDLERTVAAHDDEEPLEARIATPRGERTVHLAPRRVRTLPQER